MDGAAAELGARPRRPAAVAAAYMAATAICFFAIVAVSGGRAVVPAGAFSPALAVVDTGTVRFSAAVHPHGRATTAYFEFGLALRYREPRPAHPVYDLATTAIHLAPAFGVYTVSGTASGLVPNALYNLRLVARSSAGTVYSPNATFRTAKDPAPSLPQIGAKFNVQPTSGLVLIRPGVSGPCGHVAPRRAERGPRVSPADRGAPAADELAYRRARRRTAAGGGRPSRPRPSRWCWPAESSRSRRAARRPPAA